MASTRVPATAATGHPCGTSTARSRIPYGSGSGPSTGNGSSPTTGSWWLVVLGALICGPRSVIDAGGDRTVPGVQADSSAFMALTWAFTWVRAIFVGRRFPLLPAGSREFLRDCATVVKWGERLAGRDLARQSRYRVSAARVRTPGGTGAACGLALGGSRSRRRTTCRRGIWPLNFLLHHCAWMDLSLSIPDRVAVLRLPLPLGSLVRRVAASGTRVTFTDGTRRIASLISERELTKLEDDHGEPRGDNE